MTINWKNVEKNLFCPICGDKAHLEPETDGTGGFHTHYFEISRALAERLSRPSREDLETAIRLAEENLKTSKDALRLLDELEKGK